MSQNRNAKSILLFVVLIITGVSCSKSDTTPVVPPCLVKKISTVITDPGSSQVTTIIDTYDYDSGNKLIKNTRNFSSTGSPSTNEVIVYNYANGAISSTTYGSGDNFTWTVQNGKAVKVSSVRGTATTAIDITYNGDGRLSNWHFGSVPNQVEMGYTPVFDLNGNVSKDETFLKIISSGGNSSSSDSRTYSGYDSKNNPYSLLAQSMGLLYYFQPEGGYWIEGYGKNNPGTCVDITKDLVIGNSQTYNYAYTYEYNSKDYVTKSIRSATGQSTVTTTFEYTSCN
ncbi:MAG: hypothetical protein WDN75_17770 [Bacteroidota bacterium]